MLDGAERGEIGRAFLHYTGDWTTKLAGRAVLGRESLDGQANFCYFSVLPAITDRKVLVSSENHGGVAQPVRAAES